jgi:PAS domain S-box-containing protein
MPDDSAEPTPPFDGVQPQFVVGLGASAGGLEALRPLIAALNPNGCVSYIVVQHMAPQHASILSDLLARDAQVVVKVAEHGAQLDPDIVYVTPPNCDASVKEGRLMLSVPVNTVGPKPSVDVLFASLARDYREHAVGVILSGTGSDGTHGARAIKAQGGLVISQSRASAKHDGMPASVVRANVVDYELDVAQIAEYLNRLPSSPPPDVIARIADDPEGPSPGELKHLLDLVYKATHLDFSQYKPGTLKRQVERRMLATEARSLPDYVRIAETDPEELSTLQRSFLISVTQFFRDREAFEALQQGVMRLCERKPRKSNFRVWIPGCATGEEAYSVAMLVLECLGARAADIELRVFATDIDNEATDFARAGVYPASALESVDEPLRARYFVEDGGNYRVSKQLRDRCVFARQDVVRDAPFLRMDLVSCRNVLIYLRQELQEDMVGKFHYALSPGGLLFLGRSESVPNGSPLFSQVDSKNRLFVRRSVPSPRAQLAAQLSVPRRVQAPPSSRSTAQERVASVHEILARRYAPSSILLGPTGEPSHFFGDSRRYVAFSEGSADFSLPSLLLPELRTEARTLLYRASQSNEEELVGYPLRISVDGQATTVRLHVHKAAGDSATSPERGTLVVFEELSPPSVAGEASQPVDDTSGALIEQLQGELSGTREHLQAVIEELETSNEELQSLNEELQASSEELQASNEELQTTNEELQATNEELTTVNDELSTKSQESQHLSETLTNVQNSVQTGIVVVDRQGRILRHNRLAVRFFGIMPEDFGTSLYGLPSYVPLPELRALVERAVLGTTGLARGERDGLHFVIQVAPYVTEVGECAGAVISLLDVTELRRAEMELAKSERRFRHLADALDEVVWMRTLEGETLYVSPSFARLSGRPADCLSTGADAFLACVHPEDRDAVGRVHHDTTQARWLHVLRLQHPDGSVRHVEERGRLVSDEASAPAYLVSSLVDVTDRVHKEEALREGVALSTRIRRLSEAVPGGLFSLVADGAGGVTVRYASPRLAELLDTPLDTLIASPLALASRIIADDLPRLRASFEHSLRSLGPWEEELVIRGADGNERWLEVRAVVEKGGDGEAVMHGFCHDVTTRKANERRLADSEERLRTVFQQAFSGIAELALDGTLRSVNQRFADLLETPPEALVGSALGEHVAPSDRAAFSALLEGRDAAGGPREAVELRLITATGQAMWAAVVVGPLRDGSGAVRGHTCIASDIQALKLAQARASALNTQLGHIVTEAADAVISVDADQRVSVFNRAAEQLFGLRAARVIGSFVSVLVPDARGPDHPFAQHALRADGLHGTSSVASRVEITGRHADGSELPLDASFSYVAIEGGDHCTAILRDIRERRAAEQRVMTLNEELARINRALDARAQAVTGELSLRTEALERKNLELQQFAYVASHDLQTPLNGIAGFLELLELQYADKLDDRGREWIGRAVESAHRLKQLIQGLLDFARMDNQAQRFTDVDLGGLCDELFHQLGDTPGGRHARLTRDALPRLSGDRLQLAQLLQNLLSNALKYRGEHPVHVHVHSSIESGVARISVRDDGIGIPPAHHERIFEMFKRLHDERTYPGAGIGLALCRRIVHRHGGEIGVSSTPGAGSTFWFTLPLETANGSLTLDATSPPPTDHASASSVES